MNAKEYLEQARDIAIEIESHNRELDVLRELSTATGAIRYDNDRVISSLPQSARFENHLVKLVDLENQIRKEIAALLEKHKEIRKVIRSVDDPQIRTVLRLRFLCRKNIDEIAETLTVSPKTIIRKLEAGYHEVSVITGLPEPPKPKSRMPAQDRHEASRKLLKKYLEEKNDSEGRGSV